VSEKITDHKTNLRIDQDQLPHCIRIVQGKVHRDRPADAGPQEDYRPPIEMLLDERTEVLSLALWPQDHAIVLLEPGVVCETPSNLKCAPISVIMF
jgi:hypothetical protein